MNIGEFKGHIPELKPGQKGLNLGCGRHPFPIAKGWVNADIAGAELNFDFDKTPWKKIKDNAYDYVYSNDVLDHLQNFYEVMREIHRITKPEGIVEITVPFYNCQTSWMPTHYQHFGLQHFITFLPEWSKTFTAENKEEMGGTTFEIIEVKTHTKGIWKLIPDIKVGRFTTLRYIVGMHIGEVVQNITVKLRCSK